MFFKILQFLISRHFQAILLFIVVFALASMQEAVPVRTKACPFSVWMTSPAGDLLVGWDPKTPFNIYETERMQQIAVVDEPKAVHAYPKKISSNNQYLLSTSGHYSSESYSFYIWNINTRQKPVIIAGDTSFMSFAFSPDSTRLVAADDWRKKSSEKTRYTLGIWNVETGERLHELAAGHQSWISHADWSPDGTRIATASWDGTIRLWDATTGVETKCLRPEPRDGGFRLAAFSSDGKTVVGWSYENNLISWDLETGLQKARNELPRVLSGVPVRFCRHSLEYDVICCMYSVEWIDSILKINANWLPNWSKEWLNKRLYRTDVYRYEPDTGSLSKMMTIARYTNSLLTLPGTQELLAYEYATDSKVGQLTWYSLDQSYAWVRPLSWAAGISLGYWLLLSMFAWRRRGTKKLQTV